MLRLNQLGAAPLLILLSIVGLVGFIALTQTVFFREGSKEAGLFNKEKSPVLAKSPFNPGDTDGDLDVDIFDYNIILQNFSKPYNNGDFNDNIVIDIFDYNVVLANFGTKYQPAPVAMIEGVPVCPHDATKWHSLVERNPDNSIKCTYGHEHKDDPHTADAIFGDKLYQWANGQTISYPWQTGNGTENIKKHETYGYSVLLNLPPAATRSLDVNRQDAYFLRDARIQSHFDMHAQGASTRFHSSYVELRICLKSNIDDCGIARFGGHQDYGELRIDGQYYPTVQDPVGYNPNTDDEISKRSHSATRHDVDWIGRFRANNAFQNLPVSYTGFQHIVANAFGPLDINNLSNQIITDQNLRNNSLFKLTFVNFRTRREMFPGNGQGRLNWQGYAYADKLNKNPNCSAPSLECVPVSFENMHYVDDLNFDPLSVGGSLANFKNYDVKSPVTGKSLIVYPN